MGQWLQVLIRNNWGEAMERAGQGWIDGPSPHDQEGMLRSDEVPRLANPAFRFGVDDGDKVWPAGDLKGS